MTSNLQIIIIKVYESEVSWEGSFKILTLILKYYICVVCS